MFHWEPWLVPSNNCCRTWLVTFEKSLMEEYLGYPGLLRIWWMEFIWVKSFSCRKWDGSQNWPASLWALDPSPFLCFTKWYRITYISKYGSKKMISQFQTDDVHDIWASKTTFYRTLLFLALEKIGAAFVGWFLMTQTPCRLARCNGYLSSELEKKRRFLSM